MTRTLLSKTSTVRFVDADHGPTSIVLWFDSEADKTAWLAKLRGAQVTDDDVKVARELIANWESR